MKKPKKKKIIALDKNIVALLKTNTDSDIKQESELSENMLIALTVHSDVKKNLMPYLNCTSREFDAAAITNVALQHITSRGYSKKGKIKMLTITEPGRLHVIGIQDNKIRKAKEN